MNVPFSEVLAVMPAVHDLYNNGELDMIFERLEVLPRVTPEDVFDVVSDYMIPGCAMHEAMIRLVETKVVMTIVLH